MPSMVANGNLRIGSFHADAAMKVHKTHPEPPTSPPTDPAQLQYEKQLLEHQLKLAKTQIETLKHQLAATLQPHPSDPLSPTTTNTFSANSSQATSPTSTSQSGRLPPTGYPPTGSFPIHIRRSTSHQALFPAQLQLPTNSLQLPAHPSLSNSVTGYLANLAPPPTSPAHPPPPLFHVGSIGSLRSMNPGPQPASLPTSPTTGFRSGQRSIPASPAQQSAFLQIPPGLRGLGLGLGSLRAEDLRSQTSDDGRSRSDLDALDTFASEELGLDSVQENVQVEGLQSEVDRLRGVIAMEDAEKLQLQRRVTELEDSNHTLHKQVELLREKLHKLAGVAAAEKLAAGDVAAKDQ